MLTQKDVNTLAAIPKWTLIGLISLFILTYLYFLISDNTEVFEANYTDVYIRVEKRKSEDALRLYIGRNNSDSNYIQFTPYEYDIRFPAFYFVKPDTLYVVDTNNQYIKDIKSYNIIIKYIFLLVPNLKSREKVMELDMWKLLE